MASIVAIWPIRRAKCKLTPQCKLMWNQGWWTKKPCIFERIANIGACKDTVQTVPILMSISHRWGCLEWRSYHKIRYVATAFWLGLCCRDNACKFWIAHSLSCVFLCSWYEMISRAAKSHLRFGFEYLNAVLIANNISTGDPRRLSMGPWQSNSWTPHSAQRYYSLETSYLKVLSCHVTAT